MNKIPSIAYDELQKLLNTAGQTTATLGSVAPKDTLLTGIIKQRS